MYFMKTRQLVLSMLTLVILFALACKKDEMDEMNGQTDFPSNLQLVVSPEEIKFNDNDSALVFLSTQPDYPVNYQLTSSPEWLDVSPSTGTVSGAIKTITLKKAGIDLNEGIYHAEIEFLSAGAGKVEISVTMCVDAHPFLEIDNTQIHIDEQVDQVYLNMVNEGTGFLQVQLISEESWLNPSPSWITLGASEFISVELNANRAGLAPGTYSTTLLINDNGENDPYSVEVTMDVGESSQLSIIEQELYFYYFDEEKSLTIQNNGNSSGAWNFESAAAYLNISPSSGVLGPGESEIVIVSVDRANLNTDTYSSEIQFDLENPSSMPILVTVENYAEEKWLIDGDIVDSEYDREDDEMIVVSSSPNQLRRFGMIDQSVHTIALGSAPLCVSVSPDGSQAAIGHNGYVTLVDLESNQILETFGLTTVPSDIIHGGNGYIYVLPLTGSFVKIHCIEISTGVMTLHEGSSIYDGSKGKLHPSGLKIYTADNGVSPSDFERLNIDNGVAEYAYDSPYHGTYAFSGDIWISEDGDRLFARSRNVFNASDNEESDMTYSGQLSGNTSILSLDHHLGAGKVAWMGYSGSTWSGINGDNQVYIYDDEFLAFEGALQLPGFLVPIGLGQGSFFDSEGYFGFFNSSGNLFHVLLKAEPGSLLQDEWAIYTLPID